MKLFLTSACVVWLLVATACGQANNSTQNLRGGATQIEHYTGLTFPRGTTFTQYSDGWDERFLKALLTDQELNQLVASAAVKPLAALPDNVEGMNPMGIGGWWQPTKINAPVCYEGKLQGTIKANGVFYIIAEAKGPAKRVVYVYFFKT